MNGPSEITRVLKRGEEEGQRQQGDMTTEVLCFEV